jgi:predicted O-methyltransferase YrrM
MDKVNKSRLPAITDILKNINAKKGVEIGVFKGQFTRQLLENWNGTMYMIDPWRPLGDEYIDSSNHREHTDAYERTMENIKGYENRAFMLRGLGEELVDIFEDNSLDFIYIDGNHAYDYVVQDMKLWWPKLKKGGLFAGHDYLLMDWSYIEGRDPENKKDKHIWMNDGSDAPLGYAGVFGVNPAVEEFCADHGYEFTVTDEWTASWYFIK